MGFTAITQAEIAAGQPVTQALMQKVKDNDDYLYSQAGPGNGGGYLDMSDYLPCTPVSCLTLEWLHYASVAGMHNIVQVRWFDKAKVYLSSTDIYNSTHNP